MAFGNYVATVSLQSLLSSSFHERLFEGPPQCGSVNLLAALRARHCRAACGPQYTSGLTPVTTRLMKIPNILWRLTLSPFSSLASRSKTSSCGNTQAPSFAPRCGLHWRGAARRVDIGIANVDKDSGERASPKPLSISSLDCPVPLHANTLTITGRKTPSQPEPSRGSPGQTCRPRLKATAVVPRSRGWGSSCAGSGEPRAIEPCPRHVTRQRSNPES